MKKQLFTAAAVLLSLCGYAQTKGTSTLGLGFGTSTNNVNYTNPANQNSKSSNYNINLGYGFFIEDNTRIGIDLSYGQSKNERGDGNGESKAKTYGGTLSYQKYFPLVGKFYAYAGGQGSYSRYDSNQPNYISGTGYKNTVKGDQYGIGAFGGLSWFISKRWALETQLLSAGASYSKYSQELNDVEFTSNKQTGFNMNTGGFFKDTSFKIYFMF